MFISELLGTKIPLKHPEIPQQNVLIRKSLSPIYLFVPPILYMRKFGVEKVGEFGKQKAICPHIITSYIRNSFAPPDLPIQTFQQWYV